jgi:hypothetical protein
MAAKRKPAKSKPLKASDGVQRDLDAIAKLDKSLANSGLAASALALARDIDDQGNSATSRSMCARSLIETLDRLWEMAPEKKEKDRVDDLSTQRDKRRGRSPAVGKIRG